METIVSLAKRRGFIFPGSEIYGGLANSWDYGPLAAQMRMNIKRDWWHKVVESRHDMVGLDGAILMNPRVWEASGHVDTFHDPLVECAGCHSRFRADHISSEFEPGKVISWKCEKCGEKNEGTAREFNLMFKTFIGSTTDSQSEVYLRPETAQAIFVNFKNVLGTSRKQLPFGIAQIGKAFRNEITPGNFIFRTLEFEQMEIEYFIEESEWATHFDAWASWMEQWAQDVGIDMKRFSRYEVPQDDLAHYSKRTIDFMFDFPFGKDELWGLAYRTDFDLSNHAEHSGEKLEYPDPQDNKKKTVPHVVEPSLGVDRTLLAILLSAYHEEEVGGEKRAVMKFTPAIAPYQVAVLPLSKKDALTDKAQEVFGSIASSYRVDYDVTGSIGKRYRRQDEIGTPLCVTIDFDSLEDEAVTVRDRDNMQQERIPITDLPAHIANQLS